ncbi:Short-chain dehydrogenase [Desulfonatronum thiosulfatophilum]|uniref:Short-chain dehydrogenase n=1 Tax=Desulfonatronum thiosulfatophilum TaxID=617002 RepID=A0A1G6EKA3_9BACT|nr:SDR family NAD(P)-dependent oxidoreductase [Desulfonatronum thiosulfatophilum]SDB57881.1 Short-chain dehydrogenase [Desulfonatronum thiosulfatophilum]
MTIRNNASSKHALHGKTLLLTGASMGIGRALAVALAGVGVNLVINARSEDRLRETREMCVGSGAVVEEIAGDASRSEIVDAMVAKAGDIGGLWGFIHAAGLLHPGPHVWELAEEEFQAVFQANVVAAYQLIRACMPLLLRQGEGLAVFFGSGAAVKTQPGIAAYCAAKAAEEHLARQLAAEAPQITSTVYRPGVVETRMQSQARESEGGAARQLQQVFKAFKEQGQLITPEESAAGLVRLLSSSPKRLHGGTWDVRDMG